MTWEQLTLEDTIETFIDYRGKTPGKSDHGIRLITAKVIKKGRILEEPKEYLTEETYAAWMKRGFPQQWDVLITTEAPLGEVGILRSPERIALAQRVILLRANPTIADQMFLFYALQGHYVQDQLASRASGTTVLGIKQSELRQVKVSLPPLPIQRRIASILSAYDDLIENNTRRITILEEMARRLYEEWFVKFRFPGHEAIGLKESDLGPIPLGWAVLPLGDICQRITDGAHKSPKSVPQGKPMASVKDMHDWGFNVNSCRKISERDYEELVRNDCRPLAGDVLIAKDGSYLKHTFVVEKEIDLVILSSIAILRPNDRENANLLALALRHPDVVARMKGIVSGVAIPRIVLKDFRRFPLVMPPRGLQDAWNSIASPLMTMCRRLIDKNANLRAQRDLLLPKLVSGEIDVSEAEVLAEETAA